MKRLTRIRIPSRFVQEGVPRDATGVFTLGLGPCGKTVTTLVSKATPEGYVIGQRCEDGSTQRFIYPWGQLTGRIEEEYSTNG